MTTQATPETTTTTAATATDQAAADALAAQAAKTGSDGAVKTAEQIAAEAAGKTVETKTVEEKKEVVYALTMPKDGVLEAEAVERMTAFAKANGLSNDAAQKALDHTNAELVADRAKQIEANAASFQTLARETWVNEIKADKEFGGDKFDATIIDSKRAADIAFTPAEKEILNQTGWGNHPLLVKGMARLGRRMGNDTLVTGGGSGGEKPNAAQLLYGGTKAT
jgi:hypothetical protein